MTRASASLIELRLRDLAQLFNSLDPSPFQDRDLDAAAEAFIVEWARELPAGREVELVIHLATPPAPDRAAGLQEAIHNYFDNRLQSARARLRRLFRIGRWTLLIGMIFLGFCLTLSQLVGQLSDSPLWETPRLVLDIVGWVALWRPLEIFLFDWWPLRDDIRMYERLARMPVRLMLPG
jgi:hypothetical protein